MGRAPLCCTYVNRQVRVSTLCICSSDPTRSGSDKMSPRPRYPQQKYKTPYTHNPQYIPNKTKNKTCRNSATPHTPERSRNETQNMRPQQPDQKHATNTATAIPPIIWRAVNDPSSWFLTGCRLRRRSRVACFRSRVLLWERWKEEERVSEGS